MLVAPPDGPAAELEARYRLDVVQAVIAAMLAGHLDSGLILLAGQLLDQAGAWTMLAEEAGRLRAA